MNHSFEGIHIETLKNPYLYSQQQIDHCCFVAANFNHYLDAISNPSHQRRGKFVFCELPKTEKA